MKRLTFIAVLFGNDAAIEFAKTTYKVYRRALLTSRKRGSIRLKDDDNQVLFYVKYKQLLNTCPKNIHHASIPEFRKGFIESCVVFRKFIKENS